MNALLPRLMARRATTMTEPRVIYQGYGYTACALRDGSLTVQSSRRGNRGIRLVGPTAGSWIENIETASDSSEARDLCRALLDSSI